MVARQVVERGAGLAADLDDVAEALGRDERRARAAPLEQGVRRDGHAVRQRDDGGGIGAARAERGEHAEGLVGGRRRDLRAHHAGGVDADEIGEGAAHVDADPHDRGC